MGGDKEGGLCALVGEKLAVKERMLAFTP